MQCYTSVVLTKSFIEIRPKVGTQTLP